MVFSMAYIGILGYIFTEDHIIDNFSVVEIGGYAVGMFLMGVMFGLWPDVDINSKGQRLFYSIFLLADIGFIVARNFEAAAYLGLFSILPTISKHRGWTHTWWAMLLIPSPMLLLPMFLTPEHPLSGALFYGAAVTGYFSHLLLDGLIIKRKRKRRKPANN